MSTPQLQSTKPSAALVSAFLDQLTPFMTSILTNNQLNDFLSPQNVNPFLKSSFTVVDNLQFLGSKLLKSAASSFAYSSFPTADTEKLTAVVANLVSGESLAPFIATIRVDKESSFHVLLGYCCRVLGVEVTANAILGGYFASALALTKNALDIPQILNALRPGAHLQGLSREQRIDLVRQELRSRFIYVSEPQQMDAGDDDDADGDDSSPLSFSRAASSAFGADGGIPPTPHHQPPTCFRVTVSRGTLDKQTVHFYSEVEAKEYVLVVARQFIKEMKDAKKSGGGGVAEGDDAEDGGAPKATTPKLTLDEVDPAQATAFGLFLMHTCKRILRFESPYDDKLETMGRLAHCVESGGWIPITDVQTLLIEHLAVTCSNIEQPQLDFICRMLEEHDGLQRFEIGLCSLSSSPFYGVRCARALYAHHGAVACATIPLYRSILDSFERPGGCPSTGWMLFDNKQIKNFKTRGLRLFDNNLLLTVVSQYAIVSTFVPYLERGEMHSSVPYLQRCMLDEKVRAPMFFVEVYIGAAFHDSHMTVKQHPDRGDTPGHFILMPTGHRYRKKAKGSEAKYFPLRFLSGRTLELKYASPPGAATTAAAADGGGPRGVQLVTGTIALPVDPVVQFDETELAELLRLGGGTAAEPVVESEPSVDPSAEDALPTPDIVRLDDAPLREKVEAFHRDENIVMMELDIPRCSRVGGSLFERSKTVGELKAWIMTLGLEYRELPRRSGCDVLLLRKHQAFPEYVLDEIIGELSLESLGRRDLLRKAITRECINSSENYERLEFIGDAVLDLVVALDATIVYGGCLTAGDCDAVQKLRSSGTLPVSSATQHAPPVCNGVARSVVQVAVDVCRNEVLSELLPRVLHAHMGTLYGDDVPMKVKADMFEAIVGAVYDSELGLDMVRRVVADLYHQNLHDAMKRKEGNPEALWKCRLAMQLCPYVNAEAIALLGTIQPLNCAVIMVGKNQEELASPDDNGFPGGDFGSFGSGSKRKTLSSRKFTTANSHLASTGFPRIQDKDYATHFTTGTVYSYRRLGEHDMPSMQNRMLQLFHEGSIGFVNETLGDVTRLTFDIDGVNMKSYGLVHILREWIRTTWGVQNSPSALILNCSGKSVVSKKQKFSCHVHIPDQVLTIDALTKRTSSLRSFIVDFFAKNVREGCLGTGSLVTGRVASGSSLNNPAQHQPTTTTIIGRVVLDMQLMIKRFNSVMEYESHMEWASAAVDADGYRSLPEGWTSPARKSTLLLSFLGLKDLLLAMTVSKTFYRAGVLLLTDDIDANPSAWVRRYLVPMQQEAANVAKNPLPSIIGHRNINLRSAQVVHVLNTDHTWSGRFVLCDCIHGGFSYIRAAQDVEPFVDEHSAGKPKRFFELLQPHLDKSIFDASFWEKTVDHGLVESKKLRMYLNDKFDTVYGQEFRPLLFDSIVDPVGAGEAPSCYKPSISSAIGVFDERSDACQGPATRASEPLHVNHRALLEAATLRSPTVWDAYGGANELWDTDDLFSSLPCLDAANILDAVAPDLPAYHEDVSVTPNSVPPTVTSRKNRHQNRLPSFEDIRTAPACLVSCNDWQLWCSGVFSITEVKEESWGNIGGSKIQRHAALFPASWRYCDATRTASFQVLGETLFSICGIADLSTAIGDYGCKGMAMLSRILTPHVNVDASWRTPSNQFRSWLELWEESGRGGLGGTGQSIAAQQQNQQRGRASGNNGGPEAVVVNGVTLKTVGSSAPSAAPATTQSVRGTPAASGAPPSTAVAKSGPTSPSSPHSFEESAQYFRMKFDRIDFQPMADMQGCAPDGSFQHVEWMLQQHGAISDVCIATAIRRWTKGWQGLVDGRGALVATRRPLLGVLFLDVASDSFAPYLTVQVLDLIKPSKRATTELRAALAVSETPFTAIIYAERTIETSTFYWLLERLQPHGTCWFVFREAFEESQKLRGSSCFHGT